MAILELNNITKSFGHHKANDNISFEVPEGSIFGLLGPNGAGKSTLIRIITNIIAADSGTVRIAGDNGRVERQALIGYMPEERGLYKKMKVGEHLIYLARLKNMSAKDAKQKIDMWMEKFGITGWWDKRIDELSKGMQQKIQFIATIVHEPPLLILDEPFSGLDPINSNLIQEEIFQLRKRGASIIFSTHRMEQVEEICEQIVLVNNGRNILQGDVKNIRQNFKKHKFSVQFEGEVPMDLQSDHFSIAEKKDNNIIVQGDETSSPNQLLRILLEKDIAITAFREVLPSINEIFIDQVMKGQG